MNQYSKEDIMRIVEEEDIEFIRLQFTDIFGNLKNVAITSSQLEKALDNKCMFDGSSIEGFVRIEESDMYLYPDLNTFCIFPWKPQQGKVARLICDVYCPDGTPFECDPRYILKREIQKIQEMGYSFDVGPEDLGENARRDMVLTLEDMGFEVEASHHEVAPAQHEIDFKYAEALHTADNIMTFELAVKTIAKRHGLHATFMPKPKFGICGSGMHTNMSLTKDGENVFCDPNGALGLSKEAYYFIGGIMKHIKGMAAVTNPLVNSYKRMVAGYEAPVYIAWSCKNRSPLIRIPASRGAGTRVELRSPDPSCNPYLTLALCLAAGMDGIKNQIMPPAGVDGNIFEMTDEELCSRQIEKLPASLMEAIEEMEADTFVRGVLGEHIYQKYDEAKREEWNTYCTQVTQWEIDEYLYKF